MSCEKKYSEYGTTIAASYCCVTTRWCIDCRGCPVSECAINKKMLFPLPSCKGLIIFVARRVDVFRIGTLSRFDVGVALTWAIVVDASSRMRRSLGAQRGRGPMPGVPWRPSAHPRLVVVALAKRLLVGGATAAIHVCFRRRKSNVGLSRCNTCCLVSQG